MQVSQDPVIIIRRIISGLWPLCKNRTLLSCCLDPYSSAVVIPDHIGRGSLPRELPCELWSETSRAFQAVRLYRLEPAFFFIAITLIVSVTASRRAPQLGRIFLLLPLDSPLSEKSDVADKEFSVGFALAGEIRLSVSGVCPFLFCALIISSILYNVKHFLRTFSPHIAQ